MSGSVRAGDVILLHDNAVRATMTASRPFANRVLVLSELEPGNLTADERVAYLESVYFMFE